MSDILILINVVIPVVGPPRGTPKLLLDNKPAPDPLNVKTGDRVGWYVQVGDGRSPLPYRVTFRSNSPTDAEDAFFGVTSVAVPAGGLSPLLGVKVLQGSIKYAVEVTGLGIVLDPDIQTGSDLIFSSERVPSNFTVTWNIDNNTVSCQNDGSPQGFPIPISVGDTVAFEVQTGNPPAPNSDFVFPVANNPGNTWASPFYLRTGAFAAPTEPLPVSDGADHGNTFTFNAQTEDGTKVSANYEMKLT